MFRTNVLGVLPHGARAAAQAGEQRRDVLIVARRLDRRLRDLPSAQARARRSTQLRTFTRTLRLELLGKPVRVTPSCRRGWSRPGARRSPSPRRRAGEERSTPGCQPTHRRRRRRVRRLGRRPGRRTSTSTRSCVRPPRPGDGHRGLSPDGDGCHDRPSAAQPDAAAVAAARPVARRAAAARHARRLRQRCSPSAREGEQLVARPLLASATASTARGNTPQYMGNYKADLATTPGSRGGDPGAWEVVIREGVFGTMPANPDLTREQVRGARPLPARAAWRGAPQARRLSEEATRGPQPFQGSLRPARGARRPARATGCAGPRRTREPRSLEKLDERVRDVSEMVLELKDVVRELMLAIASKPGSKPAE